LTFLESFNYAVANIGEMAFTFERNAEGLIRLWYSFKGLFARIGKMTSNGYHWIIRMLKTLWDSLK
jgi:hypothetical protein